MFEISPIDFISSYMARLDTNYPEAVISSFDVDKDDDTSLSFIEGAILATYSSKDMKWARFDRENPSKASEIVTEISNDMSKFRTLSAELVQIYYDMINNNFEIPTGDLIVSLFQMADVPYLGFFKYNYKTFQTSILEPINDGKNIYIKKTSSLYATARTKPDEGFIVHLPHIDIALSDKKYTIAGEKSFILSENILRTNTGKSQKEKLNSFNNITKNIEKKYLLDDPEEKARLKKVVKDCILDTGYIDVGEVVEVSFADRPELKSIYESSLEKAGVKKSDNIEIDSRTLKTKYVTQKIITESGISLDIPVEYYGDENRIEFLPNENGTLSIIIKNIKNIIT